MKLQDGLLKAMCEQDHVLGRCGDYWRDGPDAEARAREVWQYPSLASAPVRRVLFTLPDQSGFDQCLVHPRVAQMDTVRHAGTSRESAER